MKRVVSNGRHRPNPAVAGRVAPILLERRSAIGPVAMKAVRQLRRQLLTGRLATGMLLPSVRELAAATGIGLVTAHKALQRVEEEGWGERKRGDRRLRITSRAPRLARAWFEQEPPAVVYWVVAADRRLQAEFRLPGLSEGLHEGLPFSSSRYLFLNASEGPARLEALEEQARSAEVGYLLLSVPGRLQRLFKQMGAPCVVLGDVEPDLNLPNVYADQRKIGLMAGGLLYRPGGSQQQKGSGRVVTLCGEQLVGGETHLITGVSDAARLLGRTLPRRDDFYCSLPHDPEALLAKLDQLLAGPDRPGGILATRAEFAVATLRAAAKRGLSIPRDLQLVGVPHHPLFEFCHPQISSIGAPSDAAIGRRCAELLTDCFLTGARRAPTIEIEPTVIERESTVTPAEPGGSVRG